MTATPYTRFESEGVHRLAIPIPFDVGHVNLYLIDDDPLTLVDTGPNSGTSLDALERALASRGRSIEDLELAVLTHHHVDHTGLAGILAERSGAEVAAVERLVPLIERFGEAVAAEDEFAEKVMLRHGLPADVVAALRSVTVAFRGWGAPAGVSRVLRDGDELRFGGRELTVHFRPGHSPTDTVFLDGDRGMLIGGDHLLARSSSNPLITRPLDGSDERPSALVTYLESLRRTRELDLDAVLPGHGDPVLDHRELIDTRLRLHARRAEKVFRLIAERPRTAYEIARALWGELALTQAFVMLSEVLGHTDLLMSEGRVIEVEAGDGRARFEPRRE